MRSLTQRAGKCPCQPIRSTQLEHSSPPVESPVTLDVVNMPFATTGASLRRLPLFFAYCPDRAGVLAKRLAVRPAHWARWKEDLDSGRGGKLRSVASSPSSPQLALDLRRREAVTPPASPHDSVHRAATLARHGADTQNSGSASNRPRAPRRCLRPTCRPTAPSSPGRLCSSGRRTSSARGHGSRRTCIGPRGCGTRTSVAWRSLLRIRFITTSETARWWGHRVSTGEKT